MYIILYYIALYYAVVSTIIIIFFIVITFIANFPILQNYCITTSAVGLDEQLFYLPLRCGDANVKRWWDIRFVRPVTARKLLNARNDLRQ